MCLLGGHNKKTMISNQTCWMYFKRSEVKWSADRVWTSDWKFSWSDPSGFVLSHISLFYYIRVNGGRSLSCVRWGAGLNTCSVLEQDISPPLPAAGGQRVWWHQL